MNVEDAAKAVYFHVIYKTFPAPDAVVVTKTPNNKSLNLN